MSLMIRGKIEAANRDYFDELYRVYGMIPENHQTAVTMRMHFFSKYVLERSPSDYKTPIEKDWAYVARREYRYVTLHRAARGKMLMQKASTAAFVRSVWVGSGSTRCVKLPLWLKRGEDTTVRRDYTAAWVMCLPMSSSTDGT